MQGRCHHTDMPNTICDALIKVLQASGSDRRKIGSGAQFLSNASQMVSHLAFINFYPTHQD
jgi:hypothetical protein